jgi:hypothetical protein
MGQWTGFMILIYAICLYLVWCTGVQIQRNTNMLLRVVATVLLIVIGMGYAVRIVYASIDNIKAVQFLSGFYFISTIGIILLSTIGIWYLSPLYKKQGKLVQLLVGLAPFVAFYSVFIAVKPIEIINRASLGYSLTLVGKWSVFMGILQELFIALAVISCIIGIIKTNDTIRKSQYLVYALGFILMLIDGLSIALSIQVAIPPFSFSEAYGLFAILYSFSNNSIA